MAKFYLGIDIGTYSSKGVIVNEQGEIVAKAFVSHDILIPKPGYAEQDAQKVWWHDFCRLSKSLLAQSAIDPKQIACISHSGMSPCLVALDKDGNALHPAILYGIDTRACCEQRFLTDKYGSSYIESLSGTALSSQAVTPKILWLKRHCPEVFNKARYLCSLQGYITFKLSGKYVQNIYDSIGYPLIYNQSAATFDVGHLKEFGLSYEMLPALYWNNQIVGTLTKDAAAQTGLAEGTSLLPGCADAAAEALAAGLANIGDLMIMYGSSTFFICKTNSLVKSDILWANHFLEKNSFVLTGGTATCGSLITWFSNELSAKTEGNKFEELMKLIDKPYNKINNDIVCLPYFSGERTPINDNNAKGLLFGLSLKTKLSDLYQGLLEGIAFSIRHNLELIRQTQKIDRILAIGGCTYNNFLMQAVSDISGICQYNSNRNIGACYGDCIIAAAVCGQFENISQGVKAWVKNQTLTKPDIKLKQHYDKKYKIYRKLYIQNKNLMV